ncbi:DNA (cytosine-5-)-methyltransferase [Lysinibacillus fusiformis]|uniref:DNA (cytosine-5-)-methyltransferase n=1 Tax=Lysinibacillus fusiformis TaxID=28031 RepID=UPI00301A8675
MTENQRYFHFPTPDGINNTLRTGGKGSLTAKHNYDHIAIPVDYEFKGVVKRMIPTITKHFAYASAFAGIGGMTLGLKPLGGDGVIAWEYDPTEKRRQYAQDAHKLLHPEIPVHGDICKAITDELPDFDVFCFTPPCQAFSVAGKRGGFDDTRGTLTFEALRIAKAKKPKILFMENVKGLVNHDKGNTMGTIIHAINEIGYTVDFTVLNSKYFDVAQNRERVYLIAIRDDLITPEPWNDVKGSTMLPKAKRRYQEEGARTFNFDWPEQTEVRTRLRDFLEPIVDEKYYIDEEKTAKLVTQLEEKTNGYVQGDVERVGNVNPSGNGMNGNVYSIDAGLSPTLTTNKGEGVKMLERTDRIIEVGKLKEHRNSSLANSVHSIEGISSTFDTMQGGGREPKILEESPILLGHIDLKGRDAIKRVYSPTLTAMGGGHREPKIADVGPKYRIRKLTPRECLRLQSVPEDVIDSLSTQFSDSRLYKFAGNGLTTNVITAIGERLIKYL